jgi:hypothetical protein
VRTIHGRYTALTPMEVDCLNRHGPIPLLVVTPGSG